MQHNLRKDQTNFWKNGSFRVKTTWKSAIQISWAFKLLKYVSSFITEGILFAILGVVIWKFDIKLYWTRTPRKIPVYVSTRAHSTSNHRRYNKLAKECRAEIAKTSEQFQQFNWKKCCEIHEIEMLDQNMFGKLQTILQFIGKK